MSQRVKYNVWYPADETELHGRQIYAESSLEAAKEWAVQDDLQHHNNIAKGTLLEVQVRCLEPYTEPVKVVVSGKLVPTYEAELA